MRICPNGGTVDAPGSNPGIRKGVWVRIPLWAPKNPLFDFYKKILYNIYRKLKKGIKNMFDDFTTQIQSDENWVETLIHMENINRLLEEEEN